MSPVLAMSVRRRYMALGTDTVQETALSSGRADVAAASCELAAAPELATSSEAAASCELALSPEVAAAPEAAAERPLRILILEDRAMDADLVIRRLRRSGFAI